MARRRKPVNRNYPAEAKTSPFKKLTTNVWNCFQTQRRWPQRAGQRRAEPAADGGQPRQLRDADHAATNHVFTDRGTLRGGDRDRPVGRAAQQGWDTQKGKTKPPARLPADQVFTFYTYLAYDGKLKLKLKSNALVSIHIKQTWKCVLCVRYYKEKTTLNTNSPITENINVEIWCKN